MKDLFYRLDKNNNAVVLYKEDGAEVTRIESSLATTIYPINSDLSCAYEHAQGIVLSIEDAEKLGIEWSE